jgi:hypothetical protein
LSRVFDTQVASKEKNYALPTWISTLVVRPSENLQEDTGNSVDGWGTVVCIELGDITDPAIGVHWIWHKETFPCLVHRAVCVRGPDCISLDLLLSSESRLAEHDFFVEHCGRNAEYRAFAAGFSTDTVR